MFAKALTLLLLCSVCVSSPALSRPPLAPGPYTITSVFSSGTLQDHGSPHEPIFVLQYEEHGPLSVVWDIDNAPGGGYTLRSRLYKHYAALDLYRPTLIAGVEPTTFFIEDAGDGRHVIKVPNKDELWTWASPLDGRAYVPHIDIQGADGSAEQLFVFARV